VNILVVTTTQKRLGILRHLATIIDTQGDTRMLKNICIQTSKSTTAALLLALTISLTGCATMGRDVGSEGSFAPDWSNAFRLPSQNSELLGLSAPAREIERHLGYE